MGERGPKPRKWTRRETIEAWARITIAAEEYEFDEAQREAAEAEARRRFDAAGGTAGTWEYLNVPGRACQGPPGMGPNGEGATHYGVTVVALAEAAAAAEREGPAAVTRLRKRWWPHDRRPDPEPAPGPATPYAHGPRAWVWEPD